MGTSMEHGVRNFEEEVIRRSFTVPVLVDFWAEWCAPCRILSPVLEHLVGQGGGKWVLAKVNTEEFPDLAVQYGIQSIPNVKLFFEGVVAGEFVGALPEYAIAQWLKNNLPSKRRAKIEQAQSLLSEQRQSEAEIVLMEVLAEEPDNQEAKAALARACLFSDANKALRLIDEVEDARYSERADNVGVLAQLIVRGNNREGLPESAAKQQYGDAIQSLARQDFDRAVEQFIDVIRTDRYYDDDGARKACIAIFTMLGEDHPVTKNHRRDFSSALY